MVDLSVEKLVPLAVLAAGTVVGTVAQAMPELPASTGAGEIGQLSAVAALIWILVRTLPAAFSQISEDRRLDREERQADRKLWLERVERMEKEFSCHAKENRSE